MEFESHDEAYSFYLKYSKHIGFGISIKHSRRSKISKPFINIQFACTRYGVKRDSYATNQRLRLKIDCKAILYVKRRLDGKWYVHNFIKEHNHEVYPSHTHYFPCHRRITPSDKNNINTLYTVGVRTNKFFAAIAKQWI